MDFFETAESFRVRNFRGPIPEEYKGYPSSPGVLIALGANFNTPDPDDPRFIAAWNGDGPFGAGNHPGFVKIVLENLGGADLDAISSLGFGEKIKHEEFWGEYRFYLVFRLSSDGEIMCDFDEFGTFHVDCGHNVHDEIPNDEQDGRVIEFQSRVASWLEKQCGPVSVIGADLGIFYGPCESCGRIQDGEHRYTIRIDADQGFYTKSVCKDCINFLSNKPVNIKKSATPALEKHSSVVIQKRKNKRSKIHEKQLSLFAI
jgi:hypothetical protein